MARSGAGHSAKDEVEVISAEIWKDTDNVKTLTDTGYEYWYHHQSVKIIGKYTQFKKHAYGPLAPGRTSHVKFPGAFLNKCLIWSYFLCD